MKFEKKLIILSGGSFAKGTLNLERNAFGTFATFNVYNLPDLNDGEYAAGIKNSDMTFKRKLGNLGRILARFKIDDIELKDLHCVIYDTLSEEPLLYGTSASEKLWDGNMMDGFREKRSGADAGGVSVNGAGGYFLDILQRDDPAYCDTALASVNYYPRDMSIKVTYSGRDEQPPVVNAVDEEVMKRTAANSKGKAGDDGGKTDCGESVAENESDGGEAKSENNGCAGKESGGAGVNAGDEFFEKNNGFKQSVGGNSEKKSDSDENIVSGQKAARIDSEENKHNINEENKHNIKGVREESDFGRKAVGSEDIKPKAAGDSDTVKPNAAVAAENIDKPNSVAAEDGENQKTGGIAEGFGDGRIQEREAVSLRRMSRPETDGGADFVIFEPPLKGGSAARGGGGFVKTENFYENTKGKTLGGAQKADKTAVVQGNAERTASKSAVSDLPPVVRARGAETVVPPFAQVKRAETAAQRYEDIREMEAAAAAVPPVSHYTAEKAVYGSATKKIFYEQVKPQIDELFTSYPHFEQLETLMPDTRWVKVDYDGSGKYYVVGLIGTTPDYLCYGVPSRYNPEPPKELNGYCRWLPSDAEKPDGEGFWLMFQDAVSGESVGGK